MWVMVKSSLPLRALALMGLTKSSDLRPNSSAKPQSIKLSSAPESISAPSYVAVWCITLTVVRVRDTELGTVN